MQTQGQITNAPIHEKTPVRLLVDSRSVQLQLVESGESGKVRLRGEFARCGVATENKRVYPGPLWEREINRLSKAMSERQLYGELDHPSDGRTQLTRVSHLLTNLQIKDGVVIGEAEVLDTERGKILKAILEAGGRVGISSRGTGSIRTNEKGEDVVQNDYRLMTFDFVADPADQNAFPEVFYEHKEENMERDDAKMAEEFARRVEAAKKEGHDNAEAALREEFARETLAKLAELRAQVVEQVRGELLSDPAVAGARTALDKIKEVLRPFVLPEDAQAVAAQKDGDIAKLRNQLAEANLKIQNYEEENSKLAAVAKEAGYKFFIERQIAGDPDADLIRKLLGDVKSYSDANELKSKVEAIRTDLEGRRQNEAKLQEQIEAEQEAERVRKEKERSRVIRSEQVLREENEKLRLALDKSLDANKQLMLQVYTEGRLANHPKAAHLRSLIESANPQSREEIDGLLGKFREPARDPEALEQVRARVRSVTRGGEGPTAIEEEKSSTARSGNGHYGELGVNLGELRRLSGMGDLSTPNSK